MEMETKDDMITNKQFLWLIPILGFIWIIAIVKDDMFLFCIISIISIVAIFMFILNWYIKRSLPDKVSDMEAKK